MYVCMYVCLYVCTVKPKVSVSVGMFAICNGLCILLQPLVLYMIMCEECSYAVCVCVCLPMVAHP